MTDSNRPLHDRLKEIHERQEREERERRRYEFINHRLKNWRWWALLPVMLLLAVPVFLLMYTVEISQWFARVTYRFEQWIDRSTYSTREAARKWVDRPFEEIGTVEDVDLSVPDNEATFWDNEEKEEDEDESGGRDVPQA